eukprot:664690-Pyramimonas_sp.AAC.1
MEHVGISDPRQAEPLRLSRSLARLSLYTPLALAKAWWDQVPWRAASGPRSARPRGGGGGGGGGGW